jgi:lysozyme family protein
MGSQYDGHANDRAPTEHFITKFGVTEMTYANAQAKGIVSKPLSHCNSPDDMKPIYRQMYFDANQCGEMPAPVAMVCFVDATLMGDRRSVANLQRVLGVAADGVVGAQTLAALQAADAHDVAAKLEAADLAHLRTLSNWGVYKNGWIDREQNLLKAALTLA